VRLGSNVFPVSPTEYQDAIRSLPRSEDRFGCLS
jgi:hypothetical protein